MKPSNDSFPGRNDDDLPTELQAIFIAIYAILIIATIFGNSLVISAFYKFPSLQSASNTILVSLSVADIFMTVDFVLHIVNVLIGNKLLPYELCALVFTINLSLNSVIILHLALISVERFIAVKFALRYHTIVTNRRAVIASTVIWLWGIAVALVTPEAIKVDGPITFMAFLKSLTPCFDGHHNPAFKFSLQSASVRGYLIFLVISLLVVPIVIILVSYSYIVTVAYKQRRQILQPEANMQRKLDMKLAMKGARTVAIVVGICLVSFLPLVVVLCLRFLTSTSIRAHQMYAVYLVASLNACWNPLIYCWRNENFRKSFKRLLKCNS